MKSIQKRSNPRASRAFRSLLIHVNNAISSAKSFVEDNLSISSIPPHSSQKERRGEAKRRERKRDGKKEREEMKRKRKREETGTSSPYNFLLEPRAHQNDSIPDDERRRGEERTKLDQTRPPISSISSTEDQRGIIGFFDV